MSQKKIVLLAHLLWMPRDERKRLVAVLAVPMDASISDVVGAVCALGAL